jgi:hypothetical protein
LRLGLTERESQRSIMGAMRTIRRAALAAVCLALLGACDDKRADRLPPPRAARRVASANPARAAAEQPNSTPSPAPLPSAVVQTLRSLREQRLEISAPPVPSALLSFGTGRLLQASLDKVTFRDSKQGLVITEASTGTVRAVARGVDGSLFAIGALGGARLEPRATAAKPFPHVTFLPGSELLPDLEDPSHFFIYYPEDPELCWYPFVSKAGSLLAIETSFRLEGCRGPIAQLRDGAIVCRSATGFVRQAPRGSRAEFSFPAEGDPLVRLLPGQRLDEFFAVSKAGEVLHLRMAVDLMLLARFRLPAPAYAAMANTEALAFVLVHNPQAGQPRSWSLLVTDLEGRARFERDLPATAPGADDAWLATVVEDKNLAISAYEPLVAVGGARRVTVWDYAQGRELFTR